MKKFTALMIMVLMVVAVLASGCTIGKDVPTESKSPVQQASASQSGAASSVSEGAANNTPMKLAYIDRNTGNPYCERQGSGFKKAVEELGQEAITRAPEVPTVEAQIQIIEEVAAQNVSAMAIVANDALALAPIIEKVSKQGVKVFSVDAPLDKSCRLVHVNQADAELIGRVEVQAIAEMMNYEGDFAILSATSQSSEQNTWIGWMKKELEDPKYAKMKLVKIAYGDDLRDKSVAETEGLLKTFPNLKGIISPTTVGMAAAGKVLTDKGLKGKVYLTGLGLPSEMAEYIKNGVCPWMYLWNPIDVGYLAGHTAYNLATGTITGKAGEKFQAGTMGEKEIIENETGTEIMLGEPYKFDANNIDEWKDVY